MKRKYSQNYGSSKTTNLKIVMAAKDTIKNSARTFSNLGTEYLDRQEPYHDAFRALLSHFNLWTAVNGVFVESDTCLDARLGRESDVSTYSIIIANLRSMCTCMAASSTWRNPDPLDDIRSALDSLHSLGAAIRAAYPTSGLVRKLREAIQSPQHRSRSSDLLTQEDVAAEVEKLRPGCDQEKLGSLETVIFSKYQMVFAILLLLSRPAKIFGFMKENLDDSKLPVAAAQLGAPQKASKRSAQPANLTSVESDQFLHFQQIFQSRYPNYFKTRTQPRLQIPDKPHVPSRRSAETQDYMRDSGSSKRRKVSSSLSYLDLHEISSITRYENTLENYERFAVGLYPPKFATGRISPHDAENGRDRLGYQSLSDEPFVVRHVGGWTVHSQG